MLELGLDKEQLQIGYNLMINLIANALAIRFLEDRNLYTELTSDVIYGILAGLDYKEAKIHNLKIETLEKLWEYFEFTKEFKDKDDEKKKYFYMSWYIFQNVALAKKLPKKYQEVLNIYETTYFDKSKLATYDDVRKTSIVVKDLLEIFKQVLQPDILN